MIGSGIQALHIRRDDLDDPRVLRMLQTHRQSMTAHSPIESVHALDMDALRDPSITFWTAWTGEELLGCGALRELDDTHAEIKAMRTTAARLRQGVASRMLRHLLDEAARRGYRRLSLETGAAAAFEPARQLYGRFGFVYCGPFGDYVEDPYSVFITRVLTPVRSASMD